MADKYKIKTVNDFLAIPEDKLEKCLDEFKVAVLATKAMVDLENAIGQVVGVKEVVFMPSFTWVDDEANNITINVIPSDR